MQCIKWCGIESMSHNWQVFPEEWNCHLTTELNFFFLVSLHCQQSYTTLYVVASLQKAGWRVLHFSLFYGERMNNFLGGWRCTFKSFQAEERIELKSPTPWWSTIIVWEKGCLVYFLFSKRVLYTECNSDTDGMLLVNLEHTFLILPFTRQKCRFKMWTPLGLNSHAAKQARVPLRL